MKKFEGFQPEMIDFLWELRMNNSKEWMDQNRERYRMVLKEPFDCFAAELAQCSPTFCGEKMDYSISRINRDIRYSRDKSPYRACRWVVFHEERVKGTGWKVRPTFYFELNCEGFAHGLGLYCATPAYLTAFRKKIDSNPAAFLRIAKKVEKDPLFVLEGEDYKKIKNDSLDPLLQNWYKKKEILVHTTGGMEEFIFSPELPQILAEEWSRLKGLHDFLREIEVE